MPKLPTFPDLLDEVRQITIADLRRLGYLTNCHRYHATGPLRWLRGEKVTASVSVRVEMTPNVPYVELEYLANGKPIKYRIGLVNIPSNLGKGKCWFFRCPATGRRCRTLYGIGDYFLSRHAYPSAMYSKQTESKRWREMRMVYASLETRDQFSEKHARTHYNGMPTRRYRRHIALVARCENRVRRGGLLDRVLGR